MAKTKLYFAHPISSYGTPEEAQIIKALQDLGFKVINPNDQIHQDKVKSLQAEFNTEAAPKAASPHIMKYFVEVCDNTQACAILSFPNDKFGAGTVKEAQSFIDRGMPLYEVKLVGSGNVILNKLSELPAERCLSVDETRAMLAELNTAGYTPATTTGKTTLGPKK